MATTPKPFTNNAQADTAPTDDISGEVLELRQNITDLIKDRDELESRVQDLETQLANAPAATSAAAGVDPLAIDRELGKLRAGFNWLTDQAFPRLAQAIQPAETVAPPAPAPAPAPTDGGATTNQEAGSPVGTDSTAPAPVTDLSGAAPASTNSGPNS